MTDINSSSALAYYIAFGAHGPRAQAPKGEGLRIFFKVLQLTTASVAIFYTVHYFAGKQPGTMSKEWQEATNEYAIVRISLLLRLQSGEVSA